jgi:hypothetical protein
MNATLFAGSLVLAAAGLNPPHHFVDDHVDVIEVNHVYDARGQHVFDQTIFYEWSSQHERYQVMAWRLLKANAQMPIRNWQRGDYQAVWNDGSVLRRVRSANVRHSWTQHDPELLERENLPRDQRRELTIPLGPEFATAP